MEQFTILFYLAMQGEQDWKK